MLEAYFMLVHLWMLQMVEFFDCVVLCFKHTLCYTIVYVHSCVCLAVNNPSTPGVIAALKGSYDAILKIIILCIWCNIICWHNLMFKKLNIFQILYIIVVPLCPASLKCVVFYKVPLSNKCSLLWLANWPRALWLVEHHTHGRKCKPLTIIASFIFQVSFISSSPKGEQSLVTETVTMLLCICHLTWCVSISESCCKIQIMIHL